MASHRFIADELSVIAPSLGIRYSGINASMIAVLPEQAKRIRIAALGFRIGDPIPRISVWQFCRHCWRSRWRVWHPRRHIDMLVGLIARYVFRFALLLVFTSAAQPRHCWITRLSLLRMDVLNATSAAAARSPDRDSAAAP